MPAANLKGLCAGLGHHGGCHWRPFENRKAAFSASGLHSSASPSSPSASWVSCRDTGAPSPAHQDCCRHPAG
ncbi:hypothetical protein TYRP_016851 [Tyrophagus putrescentiae]|nr:hypothetical protein TYRP_016851 [Tyrophagus putrescentiae]